MSPTVTTTRGLSIEVRNVFCFGRTYAAHARELGNEVPAAPLLFLKSSRSVRGLESGPLAFADETFHHEAEVVLLVGRELALGTKASRADIEAVGLGLDLTRRGVQSELKKAGHPWALAKSFAGSALVSALTPAADVEDLDRIELSLEVEGEPRQRGSTAQLTHSAAELLSYLATMHPIGPGDLVFTGTPEGVGPIRAGERFVLESPQLGRHEGRL